MSVRSFTPNKRQEEEHQKRKPIGRSTSDAKVKPGSKTQLRKANKANHMQGTKQFK